MHVLVYAPHGIVGEDGSKVVVTDTLEGAQWEMNRQLIEYAMDNGIALGYTLSGDWHATADVYAPDSAEWHIYEA